MGIKLCCGVFLLSFLTSGLCKATAPDLARELDHIMKDIKEIESIADRDTHDKQTPSPKSTDLTHQLERLIKGLKAKRTWKTTVTSDSQQTSTKRGRNSENCAEGFIPCGGSGSQCIRAEYLCDGFKDCYDNGWDEDPATCGAISCPHHMIKCNNTGRCITRHDMCNDINDCDDLEDENINNCGIKRCGHSSTKCPHANLCVPNEYWCDGSADCPGGEDEKYEICKQVPCSGVRCSNGKCIQGELYCDGFPDCSNGEDEDITKCGPVRCPPFAEQCGTANYCYREPRWRTCDGHPDCPNAADERHENCIPIEYEPEQWYSFGEEGYDNNRLLNILSRMLKSKP